MNQGVSKLVKIWNEHPLEVITAGANVVIALAALMNASTNRKLSRR